MKRKQPKRFQVHLGWLLGLLFLCRTTFAKDDAEAWRYHPKAMNYHPKFLAYRAEQPRQYTPKIPLEYQPRKSWEYHPK